jgi:type IV secretion system protein VirB4
MQRNGGLLATVVEEFHVPAMYPTTAGMMFDVLKTGRKRDEYLVMPSQSPEDAIKSPIFDAIRDLTITKIFLPNPSAEFESYQRCGLTRKEFAQLKDLEVDSRTFLIKQGNQSCFAKLDLYGMDNAISILSGNTENVAIFNDVVAEVGVDPEVWMPEFQRRRRGKRQQREGSLSN